MPDANLGVCHFSCRKDGSDNPRAQGWNRGDSSTPEADNDILCIDALFQDEGPELLSNRQEER